MVLLLALAEGKMTSRAASSVGKKIILSHFHAVGMLPTYSWFSIVKSLEYRKCIHESQRAHHLKLLLVCNNVFVLEHTRIGFGKYKQAKPKYFDKAELWILLSSPQQCMGITSKQIADNIVLISNQSFMLNRSNVKCHFH